VEWDHHTQFVLVDDAVVVGRFVHAFLVHMLTYAFL
jgi:hypothetical protein